MPERIGRKEIRRIERKENDMSEVAMMDQAVKAMVNREGNT